MCRVSTMGHSHRKALLAFTSRAWSVTSSSNRYAVTFDFATMQILR